MIIAVFSVVSVLVTFIAYLKSMKIQCLFKSLLNMYYSFFMAHVVLVLDNFINKIKNKIKVEGIARRITQQICHRNENITVGDYFLPREGNPQATPAMKVQSIMQSNDCLLHCAVFTKQFHDGQFEICDIWKRLFLGYLLRLHF